MKKDKPAVSTSTKPRRKRWTSDDTELTLLGLPAAIWYAVFCYLPMFGLIIAFKNFKITPGRGFLYSLFHSDWAGFDNFKFFLTSNTFTMLLGTGLVLTALVLFYSMVLTVMRCMKGLIVANVCAIAVSALASGPCIARWELQGTTYAAVLAQLVQLVMLGGVALRMARRHFAGSGPLPKPEDPFDGLPS